MWAKNIDFASQFMLAGTNSIINNVVYGNRNFMPFYYEDLSGLEGGHEAADGYSAWNQSYIIDGSGVYITRNQQMTGVSLNW